jgi:hypothetical protein
MIITTQANNVRIPAPVPATAMSQDAIMLALATALTDKDAGNEAFKVKDLALALEKWQLGLSALQDFNEANSGDEQIKALIVSLHNNMAMAHIKVIS